MHFNMKRLGKIVSRIILYLLLLVTGLLLFSQTPWFRSFVKNQVVSSVNNTINGKLYIESLQGNFFTNLQITNLTIELNAGDTLAHIETLAIDYSPIGLLKKELRINSVFIEKPLLNLSINNESSYCRLPILLLTKRPTPFPFPCPLFYQSSLLITERSEYRTKTL